MVHLGSTATLLLATVAWARPFCDGVCGRKSQLRNTENTTTALQQRAFGKLTVTLRHCRYQKDLTSALLEKAPPPQQQTTGGSGDGLLEKAPPLHAATRQQRLVATAARFWKKRPPQHTTTATEAFKPTDGGPKRALWKKRYHSADMCHTHSVRHKRLWTDRYHRNNNKRHNRNGGPWEQTATGTACVWKKRHHGRCPWKKRYHDNASGTRNQLV